MVTRLQQRQTQVEYEYRTSSEPLTIPLNPMRNRIRVCAIELSGPMLGVPGILPQPTSSELFIQDAAGKCDALIQLENY